MTKRGWPLCTATPSESNGQSWVPGETECGARADSVHMSPRWRLGEFDREVNDGLDGQKPCREASFYCAEHGGNSYWYWFWLAEKPRQQGASIRDASGLAHLIDKGETMVAFLDWLLDTYDLGPLPQPKYDELPEVK